MIYLLEDDSSIRELVCYTLEKTGSAARGFGTPSDFYKAMAEELPELVILDVMLPEEDGLSILVRLRSDKKTADLPVIMLTAKSSEFDKVTALDKGADDYIVKPFGIMELVARVKAVARRSAKHKQNEGEVYSAANLTLSVARHEVLVGGEPVSLTYKEFELLCLLFKNRGVVLDRDRILSDIWGYEFDGENRTVDVHVRTLRQKLGAAGDVVETVRGVGYKISEEKSR
jgi:two-component system alkaline phosphatase synthesis response regulator PhoP